MPEASAGTATASVVFLALDDFARRPVAEQVRLRERLEYLIARAIEPLDAGDRIVAETPDGAALVVLGTPTDALLLARRARRGAREAPEPLALRVGVNLGPIGVATDSAGEVVLVGDSIAAGAAIADHADPGQVLAARAFRDALAATDPERAERVGPARTITDSTLRSHDVYAFEPSSEGAAIESAPAPRRRRVLVVAAASVIGILGAGVAVRAARRAAARAHRPATIELAITPFGEVRVDAEAKGRTPPLRRLELPPGKHTVEVRHPSHAPLTLQVELDPGEQLTIRHTFGTGQTAPRAASAPQKAASSARELWRDFRRQLGF
jgi:hypothetical protein